MRGIVKSLKWRSVFTKALYSARCSSSLCLKPCHRRSALGSPVRTSLPMTLLSSLNHLRNVSEGSWLGKKQWKRNDRVNARKMMIMICDTNLHLLQFKPVSMRCLSHWSGQHQHLLQQVQALGAKKNEVGSSAWQRTLIIDVQGGRELQAPWTAAARRKSVRPDKLELVASFCYLGNMLSRAGGCELSTTTHVKTTWVMLKELLLVLSSRPSLSRRGHLYSSCVQSALLHASETWPSTKPNLQHLQRKDRAMIRKICNVKPQDIVIIRSNELLAWHGIEDLDLILKDRRLCWYGHVECSNDAVKTAFDI